MGERCEAVDEHGRCATSSVAMVRLSVPSLDLPDVVVALCEQHEKVILSGGTLEFAQPASG